MSPVHEFIANFDEPDGAELVSEIPRMPLASRPGLPQVHEHAEDSSVRNLCFAWPDGRKAFFNYAYLVATEFEPSDEKNLIQLRFSSYNVVLHGYRLEALFMALLNHRPRIITATDLRYMLAADSNTPVVVNIRIEPKAD